MWLSVSWCWQSFLMVWPLCIHLSVRWLWPTALTNSVGVEIGVEVCEFVICWRQERHKIIILLVNLFNLWVPHLLLLLVGRVCVFLLSSMTLLAPLWWERWRCLWACLALAWSVGLLIGLLDVLNLHLFYPFTISEIDWRNHWMLLSTSDGNIVDFSFFSIWSILCLAIHLQRHVTIQLVQHHSLDVWDFPFLIFFDLLHLLLKFTIESKEKPFVILGLFGHIGL